jgi:hypothetical protein
MKHKVKIDLQFDNLTEAEALMTYAKTLISKSTSINEDKDNTEISSIEHHLCYHDETPSRPCEVIERQQVIKGVVQVVKSTSVIPIIDK